MLTINEQHIQNVTRRILNEYFSVSMYLKNAVYDALDCIDTKMKDRKNYGNIKWVGENGRSIMLYGVQFTCKMNFLDSDLYFNVKVCIFNDMKMLNFIKKTLGNLDRIYYDESNKEVFVNISLYAPDFKYFSDTLSAYELSTLPPAISHELMHAYQHKKRINSETESNKPVHVNNYKNRQVYNISQYLLTLENEDAQILGEALYYASPAEISAFIQQLYTETRYANSYQRAMDILEGSTYADNMDKLYNTIELVKRNLFEKGFLEYVEQLLNRPREWLIKYLEKSYKRMLTGYGKIKTIIKDTWL